MNSKSEDEKVAEIKGVLPHLTEDVIREELRKNGGDVAKTLKNLGYDPSKVQYAGKKFP